MKLLIGCLLLFISSYLSAQDNIIKVDGDEIECKVLEVTPDVIKYKRFDNLEGPTYTVAISSVFIIQYENGTRDILQNLSADSLSNEKKGLERVSIKTHTFINAGVGIGLNPTTMNEFRSYYTNVGLLVGINLEVGNVFYFTPKKKPRKWGLGVNVTWAEIGIALEHPTTIFAPFSCAAGLQAAYQVSSKSILAAYAKPGMSLMNINNNYTPIFVMNMGLNFRYQSFMIGVHAAIAPTVSEHFYDRQNEFLSYDVPHNFSTIGIKIGVAIQKETPKE